MVGFLKIMTYHFATILVIYLMAKNSRRLTVNESKS
jgi:hypothetical protein